MRQFKHVIIALLNFSLMRVYGCIFLSATPVSKENYVVLGVKERDSPPSLLLVV
jgi:hypothetical protein